VDLGSDNAILLKSNDNLPKNWHLDPCMAIFMGKIAAIRSRIICVSNSDNHEPQMHLWIICELQILIINRGSEIRSVIASF
jgi:hypothetical protein